ncbi:MAG: methyl-accepting chemotaxis protein [Pseudomonadota bacterium]
MTPERQLDERFGQDEKLSALSETATSLGYEIVDIAGFLDEIDAISVTQRTTLNHVQGKADHVITANGGVRQAVQTVAEKTSQTLEAIEGSVEHVRRAGKRSQEVATWVAALTERMEAVSQTLNAVEKNNTEIARIASQVNILAINAKIEASRAGDAGRGFAVVANAINELSRQTSNAAESTSQNVSKLSDWIGTLYTESARISGEARSVIDEGQETDAALIRVAESARETDREAAHISDDAEKVNDATNSFGPALTQIGESVDQTASGIRDARERVHSLIDMGEQILQSSVALGGSTADAPMIDRIMADASRVGSLFSDGIQTGRIRSDALFSRDYRPIPNTDPEQFTAPFNGFADRVLPEVQEAMLTFDTRVVFCAAVNLDGYLGTHNLKFSQEPGPDPEWNQANCRNRRLFNDRVGLKAGMNTGPFLLQVYRRDMGGGSFVMMKDLSAPIFVDGRHWGGLRVGYKF